MLRATCSADFHRCRPDSNDTEDTRVSAESRRIHTVTKKNVCSRQNCLTTRNVRYTVTRHEKQRSAKTEENIVNVKQLRVVTFARCPTKDVLKFRVKSFVFHTHDLTNITRKRLILQQSVERDRLGQRIDLVQIFLIEQMCTSCFPAFA